MLRTLIWDVDGTLAETERDGHRIAFNRAFERHGLPWRWDVTTYGRLLAVAGGRERLLHDMDGRADAPVWADAREALAATLHATKNEIYRTLVDAGGIAWRPGVRRVMDEATASGVTLAIATTTSRSSVDALVTRTLGPRGLARFAAIVCAEDAPAKKPDPLAYRLALERLGIEAVEAIAIEDSPNGVSAARAAGIATLVTRSDFFRDADFDDASAVCDDLDSPTNWLGGSAPRVDLATLRRILAATNAATRPAQQPAR